MSDGDDASMESSFDERDVASVFAGIFDMKASLAEIANDVRAIRVLVEDGDDEEEEEEAPEEGPSG